MKKYLKLSFDGVKFFEYSDLSKRDETFVTDYTQAMEEMDELSLAFAVLPQYRSPDVVKNYIKNLLRSDNMRVIYGKI